MSETGNAGTFILGGWTVRHLGYGAMQLAGPGVFAPPRDRDAAHAVLREAIASGVGHIDTSDFYGPHLTNEIIREALYPYPDGLVIVTKIGARRGDDGAWLKAFSREELTQAVHDNLRARTRCARHRQPGEHVRVLQTRRRVAGGAFHRAGNLQRQGLVRHMGLSNVTWTQVAEGRRICELVCVRNLYSMGHRHDDALIDDLGRDGTAHVPFFPLGAFTTLQSTVLSMSLQHSARRRCRWPWPGCFGARPTSS